MVYLNKIILYPIKSLDGVQVSEAKIAPGGSLVHDRELALFNEYGKKINAKKYPAIQQIRASYKLDERIVVLGNGANQVSFHLDYDKGGMEEWFTAYFGLKVEVRQDTITGFPDDDERFGPTIVSTESLQEVQRWFPEFDLENIRRRFRTNLELAGDVPFWEDHLFDEPGSELPFYIGAIKLIGLKPCPRCPVPSRDPYTAEADALFAKKFTEKRQETLPGFANSNQFGHFYHLCVNTKIHPSEAGKILKVGDPVNIPQSVISQD